jgi:hypothetical protein
VTTHAAEGEAAWTRGELAWPLALLAGFGGTWAGLATGLPFAASVIALVLLAPIHLTLVRLGRPGVGAVVALGALVGVIGAVIGAQLEGATPGELAPSLVAAPHLGNELKALVGGVGGPSGPALALRAAVFAAAAALSRPTRGIVPLAVALVACGAWALAVGELVAAQVVLGAAPLTAVLVLWPPFLAAELAALTLAGAALAVGAACPPDRRRSQWLAGLGLELAALAAWSFAAAPWARWARHALGLFGETG